MVIRSGRCRTRSHGGAGRIIAVDSLATALAALGRDRRPGRRREGHRGLGRRPGDVPSRARRSRALLPLPGAQARSVLPPRRHGGIGALRRCDPHRLGGRPTDAAEPACAPTTRPEVGSERRKTSSTSRTARSCNSWTRRSTATRRCCGARSAPCSGSRSKPSTDADADRRRTRDGGSDLRIRCPRGSRPSMSQIRVRMTARATDEPHRASSQLELLFDLTFVVAISRITAQLADSIANGEGLQALTPFLQVFFLIWWAWMNFTWFASSYDTDDVVYRLLTLVQMAGVLVLAAGVPAALNDNDFLGSQSDTSSCGSASIALWLRAAIEDPANRGTALRYAAGIASLEVAWVLRLVLAESGALPSGLAASDLRRPRRARALVTAVVGDGRGAPAGTRITSPNATDCSRSSSSAKCILAASSEVETAIEGRGSQRRAGDDRGRGSRRDLCTLVAVLSRACRGRACPQPRSGVPLGLLRPIRRLRGPRWSRCRARSCHRTDWEPDPVVANRRELRGCDSGRTVPRTAVGSLSAHRGSFGRQTRRDLSAAPPSFCSCRSPPRPPEWLPWSRRSRRCALR